MVLWMFYLAVGGCIALLFEWGHRKFALSDPTTVVCTVIFTAIVIVLTELLPQKGAITRFLSRAHKDYNWMTEFLLGALPAVGVMVLPNLTKSGAGGIVTWFSAFFVISEILFIALYATEEVFFDVLRILSKQSSGFSVISLTKGDYPTAIVCGFASCVCWILMGYGLAELRSHHIE
ncbi:hypothetical protein AgCh_027348 [Apium graveolens]